MNFLKATTHASTKRAFIAISLIVATAVASNYYHQRKDWLNRITLEVRASSAVGMIKSNPSRAALWLKSETGSETHFETTQWTSHIWRPFSDYRFDLPSLRYKEFAFLPDQTLKRIEITSVRLIPHDNGNPVVIPLDHVRVRSNLGEASRTADSVTFWHREADGVAAVNLEISDYLPARSFPARLPLLNTLLLFVICFAVAFALGPVFLNSLGEPPSAAEHVGLTSLLQFGLIMGLVFSLAAGAHPNSNPDEYLHVEAARYYMEHSLPPPLTSDWVTPSYSHYGTSYLSSLDPAYFVAGKAALFLQPFFLDMFTSLRFFNACLLLILFAWFATSFRQSGGPWIFLLTPQLWYVFSSYNNDAWALFVAFLLVGQIANEESCLREYLVDSFSRRTFAAGAAVVSLSCLLLLSKSNYFAVYIFFVLWLLFFLLRTETRSDRVRVALKIAPLLIIPFALRFGLQSYQQSVNGGDLRKAIIEQADRFAAADFKPSRLKTDTSVTLMNMKDRGVSVGSLLLHSKWVSITVASFFGTYGWMAYRSPNSFYYLMIAGWLILFGWLFGITVSRGPPLKRAFSIAAWLFLPLMFALSLYFSWAWDFQAQGRYLFPVLPVLFYLLHSAKRPHHSLLPTNIWVLFLVSAYGFLIFGVRPLCN